MTPAVVFLNEQHSLLPSQTTALDNHPNFKEWLVIPVPSTGWTLAEMRDIVAQYSVFGTTIIMGSPIPFLTGAFAGRAKDDGTEIFIMHNDKRCAKEITDQKTGQTKVIHTLAPDGWECVRVA